MRVRAMLPVLLATTVACGGEKARIAEDPKATVAPTNGTECVGYQPHALELGLNDDDADR